MVGTMVQVLEDLEIPDEELDFATSRSSGPGGQNVNKVNTRVTLLFNVDQVPGSIAGAAWSCCTAGSRRAHQPGRRAAGGLSAPPHAVGESRGGGGALRSAAPRRSDREAGAYPAGGPQTVEGARRLEEKRRRGRPQAGAQCGSGPRRIGTSRFAAAPSVARLTGSVRGYSLGRPTRAATTANMNRPRSSAFSASEVGRERVRHLFLAEPDVERGTAFRGIRFFAPVDDHQPSRRAPERAQARRDRPSHLDLVPGGDGAGHIEARSAEAQDWVTSAGDQAYVRRADLWTGRTRASPAGCPARTRSRW